MSFKLPAEKAVPAVIIVGAGLAGLLLGALFEQIDIPYHIFERAAEVRPLGSAMTLGPGILPVFEQLGLLEDLKKMSLPVYTMEVYNTQLKKVGSVDMRQHKALTGVENLLFARPELYKLMRKQIPDSKITMNKKILRTEEKDGKVFIHCSDNTTYEGNVLVGADGAYSGVRQSLYKRLDEQGLLPKEDLEEFSIGYVSMVGVAKPTNPEKYPQLHDDFCHFSTVLGKGKSSWTTMSVPGKEICWSLGTQLSGAEAKEQQFRNSEWGPEFNETMIKEFQDLPCPWGGTMGEVIEATPRNLISKVFFEEKCFKTWQHGRTVLVGDAAHKMSPAAGQGALSAMQDVVVLANCLHSMSDSSLESIDAAFQNYYSQRYTRTFDQYMSSHVMSKVIYGQTWSDRFLRNVILGYIPDWVQTRLTARSFRYRPQIAWLPQAENRGSLRVLPQECKETMFDKKTKAL